jgi:Phage integrase, N-terminal SAM-like domain
MTPEDPQTEAQKVLLPFDLLEGTSESARAKTAETFLELLGARVRNPNTRSAYRVAWRSFLAFCSARQLELESVKAYHVGSWLDQHPGSRSTQRQHLAAVRLLFDSLLMRGIVEYNPAARARPPRLVRESSQTPVEFEDEETNEISGTIGQADTREECEGLLEFEMQYHNSHRRIVLNAEAAEVCAKCEGEGKIAAMNGGLVICDACGGRLGPISNLMTLYPNGAEFLLIRRGHFSGPLSPRRAA